MMCEISIQTNITNFIMILDHTCSIRDIVFVACSESQWSRRNWKEWIEWHGGLGYLGLFQNIYLHLAL